jgi:hypothetical protein
VPVARGVLAALSVLLIAAGAAPAQARTLRVGPDRAFTTVRAAAHAAQNGDMILIDAGTYPGDVTAWNADNLTVRGIGGQPHMRADGAQEGGKGIWVVNGNNFTAENIEFSGARVPDRNGAGIRADIPGKLTVRGCYFHGNENGILAGAGEILIDQCVFDMNGAGDGRSHNMYIWGRTVTVRHTESKRARIGHNLKTRGETNYILYNRFLDGPDGTASYSVDVPDCGRTYLIGNVIEQGPKSENRGIVAYGMESVSHTPELYVVNNTLVNDHPKGGTFLQLGSATRAKVVNNIFTGPGSPWSGGSVRATHNYTGRGSPRFHAPASFDYRLTSRTPRSVRDAGTEPGRSATGYDLTPRREYVPVGRGRVRPTAGALDLGAFEYTGTR